MVFFRSGSESPRVVTEHVLPSVVRTEAVKAAMGCRPSEDGVLCELISLAICFSLLEIGQARSEEELVGAAGLLARGASRCAATELVRSSAMDRGSGISLRAGSQQRITKSCLYPHLFPLHSGIRGWGSADTPPERLAFQGSL